MSKFSSFLRKHSVELKALGDVLQTIALGVALDPKDKANVQVAIDAFHDASESIKASIPKVKEAEDAAASAAKAVVTKDKATT